jgi:hypothetical protein
MPIPMTAKAWVVTAIPMGIVVAGAMLRLLSLDNRMRSCGTALMAVGVLLLIGFFACVAITILLFGFLMSADPG